MMFLSFIKSILKEYKNHVSFSQSKDNKESCPQAWAIGIFQKHSLSQVMLLKIT